MHNNDDYRDTELAAAGSQMSDPQVRSRRDVLKVAAAASTIPLMSAFLPNSHAQLGSESPHPALGGAPMPLEPTTQKFIDGLAGSRPLYELTPAEAHKVLTDLQSAPVAKGPADIVDTTFPVGPTGETRIRIVRPQGAKETLPVVMYFHGGGWVLGDKITHDRLVREIADGIHAAVVFVDYINSPEAKYPTQNEQAYASMRYVVEHAKALNVDASRLAVAGDSVGGNMAAAITLMAKERKGPKIAYQVLFYPLRATVEQLRGLPDALLITDGDILRDEGEAYASKLSQAGIRVTSVRYNQTIHDFAMLNPLADTPAARGAIQQAITALKDALRS